MNEAEGMKRRTGIEITRENSVAVVAFKGTSVTDLEEIRSSAEQVGRFIGENHPKKIVFDFTGVRFFSSQVLGMLLNMRQSVQPFNGEVVISAINPQLHRIFRITNLDRIFRFFPDTESAVNDDDNK